MQLPKIKLHEAVPLLLAKSLARRPARDRCSLCGGKVAPGRPGRRCKSCRESPSTEIPLIVEESCEPTEDSSSP